VRIALLSDIHGDIEALERVWDHLEGMSIDMTLCAGDLVGYGPEPDAVVAFLAAHSITCVRGNHDRWAIQRGIGQPDPFSGVIPSAATIAYLNTLPPVRILSGNPALLVLTHGVPGSDMTYLSRRNFRPDELGAMLTDLDSDILVVGHTHEPMWYRCAEGLVVNPGAVLSIEALVRSSSTFAVLDVEDQSVTFHEVQSGVLIPIDPWSDDFDPLR
jgi:putative phosphoesterase